MPSLPCVCELMIECACVCYCVYKDSSGFHLYEESKEQNKQTPQKNTHRYREQIDGWQRGFGGLSEKKKGEGIEK